MKHLIKMDLKLKYFPSFSLVKVVCKPSCQTFKDNIQCKSVKNDFIVLQFNEVKAG